MFIQPRYLIYFFLVICLSCKQSDELFLEKENLSKEYTLDENGYTKNSEFSISDFTSSETCKDCHLEHYNEWSESMHAYSTKDPKFFSGMQHARSKYPETGERFCVQCHNPIAFLTGEDLSNFSSSNDFLNSDLPQQIKDGIGCDVCHSMTALSETVHAEDNILANAVYHLFPEKNVKYGSIKEPKENSFHESVYNPIYSQSEACLPCHDFTIRGIEAEITFTEWNRIPGLAMSGALSCQDCHMQTKPDGTHDHRFTGVDVDLTYAIGESPLHFEVEKMLKSATTLEFGYYNHYLPDSVSKNDQLNIPITITSRTAHSFPSGTSFAREAWVKVIIENNNNEILYQSGDYKREQTLDYNEENLLFFTTFFLDELGDTLDSVIDLKEYINKSLPAFSTRYHNYELTINDIGSQYLIINVSLLFRSFKPHLLKAHPELLNNLPLFEMASIIDTVYLK